MKPPLYQSPTMRITKAMVCKLGIVFVLIEASFQAHGQPIHHILMDGQSLSQGLFGNYGPGPTFPLAGPLSTTQPFDPPNLMLGDGCNWDSGGGHCAYLGVPFKPLVESVDPTHISSPSQVPPGVETIASGMANTLRSFASGFVSLVSHHGWTGTPYSGLQRTPTSPGLPVTGTVFYQTLVDAIKTAKADAAAASRAYTVDALVITHGEQDQLNHVPAAAYEADLLQWQADVSFDRNRLTGQTGTIPMFLDEMSSWAPFGQPTPNTDTTLNPASAGAALGQWWAARDHPDKIFLTTPKYGFIPYFGDNVHLSNAGYRMLGGYHAKALKKVLVDGGRWVPLAPRSISISGKVITLRLWVPAGSITIDTSTLVNFTACTMVFDPSVYTTPTDCRNAGGTWKVNGLEFYDSTNSAYISSVEVASGDTLTITLNTAPSGSDQRIRAAYSSRLNSADIFHNWSVGTNIRDTDTAVDYSGVHLYDWLVTFDEPVGFAWDPYTRLPTRGRRLALGKTATQSSTFPGYATAGAAAAVDGNTDGNFFDGSVTATALDSNPWWQVDLGASAIIDSIVIWNRTDCCGPRLNDYWAFISSTPFLATDTPSTLQNRAGTFSSHQTTAPNPSTTIAAGVQGRYVRVQLGGANYLSLAEVEVCGDFVKTTTQSSTFPGYATAGAAAAVDGNTDGNFFDGSVTATALDWNPWWQVDLGASAIIDSIVIWNRTDCCGPRLNDYWAFISDTPFLATDTPSTLQNRAGTFSSHQTTAPNPSTTIAAGAQGRYVRVQLTGVNYLSLAEVQVFEQ
jgi:hypothetical protein